MGNCCGHPSSSVDGGSLKSRYKVGVQPTKEGVSMGFSLPKEGPQEILITPASTRKGSGDSSLESTGTGSGQYLSTRHSAVKSESMRGECGSLVHYTRSPSYRSVTGSPGRTAQRSVSDVSRGDRYRQGEEEETFWIPDTLARHMGIDRRKMLPRVTLSEAGKRGERPREILVTENCDEDEVDNIESEVEDKVDKVAVLCEREDTIVTVKSNDATVIHCHDSGEEDDVENNNKNPEVVARGSSNCLVSTWVSFEGELERSSMTIFVEDVQDNSKNRTAVKS